ncbi:MAG: transcription antitermination factor NusB [Chloroflexi bacterium]|nr:transcription antitermination factor NusB [Chloroflexota bacterium]
MEDEELGCGNLPPRRRARAVALQVLYEVDATGHDAEASIARAQEETPLAPETLRFVQELVAGVLQHRDWIDEQIHTYAPAWPVVQLPAVDRNLLRLAIYEVLIAGKTPPKAAINEAVELAKMFGSDSSPRFVNGVLGSIMETVQSETVS